MDTGSFLPLNANGPLVLNRAGHCPVSNGIKVGGYSRLTARRVTVSREYPLSFVGNFPSRLQPEQVKRYIGLQVDRKEQRQRFIPHEILRVVGHVSHLADDR